MNETQDRALLSIEGNLARITLNKPARLNAFDQGTIEELHARLTQAARDPAIRCVLLTGTGRAFCAGGDLGAIVAGHPDRPGDGFRALAAVYHQCIIDIRLMPKPVVAVINGPAAGGGFSLALACDLRIMAESAFLQQAYTSSGLCIDGGSSFTLPRLVGLARALEIAMLDPRIPAARALELGLVHRVVPDDQLAGEAAKLAADLAARAVGAIGEVKALLNRSFDTPLERQLEDERQALVRCGDSPEGREGLSAFIEKRAPDFLSHR
ncbi:MAG: enoyl-CoA hydratase-related protein [Deltaproteobacteria bacterium]|nr:enoyl-CoA hydratase-related protein [Deltaproteobacteria bacterium]